MKLREITPKQLQCAVGPCPAVYESDRGTIVVVGRRLEPPEIRQLLEGRVSLDEEAIELPREFFRGLAR